MKEQEEQAGLLQKEHLQNSYELASDLRDTIKCAKIIDIIKHEEQRYEWRHIKQATGDPQMGAINLMQRIEGNCVVNILEASAMNVEI
jgi:hypothetical protein